MFPEYFFLLDRMRDSRENANIGGFKDRLRLSGRDRSRSPRRNNNGVQIR